MNFDIDGVGLAHSQNVGVTKNTLKKILVRRVPRKSLYTICKGVIFTWIRKKVSKTCYFKSSSTFKCLILLKVLTCFSQDSSLTSTEFRGKKGSKW